MADGHSDTRSVPSPDSGRDCDLLIVGAGPVGLFGAFYAGLRGLSVTVMDTLPMAGGQIMAMYPEKDILDVAGFARVKGRDLVDGLLDQLKPYEPRWLLDEQATDLVVAADHVRVTGAGGGQVRAGAVVLTSGIGSFTPKPLPAATTWSHGGVLHFVERPVELTGRDVVIVGGGDSAVDWALLLYPVASSITVVHRRDRFRAHAATLQRARDLGVRFVVPGVVEELLGDGHLTGVRLADPTTGTRSEMPADVVVAALGFHAELGPLAEWGLTLDGRHVVVDPTGATGLERVYAAGDLVTYPGKVALLATGFGEVATAVNNAAAMLDPHVGIFPGHTTALTEAR